MAEIKVGDQAPDFETVNDKNEKVRLGDLRGRRVVLYFYPKDDTPGCTAQACGFRDSYPQFEAKNAGVLGGSPGDGGERAMYGRTFMGVNRSHFVIDEQGKVLDAQYGVKPTDSPELSMKALG